MSREKWTRELNQKLRTLLVCVVRFRESLAFATEPVLCSLANVLSQHENLPQQALTALKDYSFFDVEIKYGLLQVSTFYFLYLVLLSQFMRIIFALLNQP